VSELEQSATPSSSEFVEREGLPRNYRMRADAHYVDQLDARQNAPVIRLIPTRQIEAADLAPGETTAAFARSIAKHGILQPLLVRRNGARYQLIAGRKRLGAALMAGMTDVPCVIHDVDAAGAPALSEADNLHGAAQESAAPSAAEAIRLHDVMQALAADVAGMSPLLDLLRRPGGADAFQLRTIVDLLQAQAWRAAWLASATALAAQPYRAAQARTVGAAVERVKAAFEKEARLTRMQLETAISPDAAKIEFDEQIGTAIAALILITLSWMPHCDSPRIEVRADALTGRTLKLQIVQRAAPTPEDAPRYFRAVDPLRPADPRVATAVAAARGFFAQHGGTLEITPIGGSGTVIQAVLMGAADA